MFVLSGGLWRNGWDHPTLKKKDKVLLYSLGWPATPYADHGDLTLIEIRLPLPPEVLDQRRAPPHLVHCSTDTEETTIGDG